MEINVFSFDLKTVMGKGKADDLCVSLSGVSGQKLLLLSRTRD